MAGTAGICWSTPMSMWCLQAAATLASTTSLPSWRPADETGFEGAWSTCTRRARYSAAFRGPGTTMRDAYPYFDPGGYPSTATRRWYREPAARAGASCAKFTPGFEPQLTKYPLFRLAPGETAVNPHYIWPPEPDREDRCHLGILHYKFDGDLVSKIEDAVARGHYWKPSVKYRTLPDSSSPGSAPDLPLGCKPQISEFPRGPRRMRTDRTDPRSRRPWLRRWRGGCRTRHPGKSPGAIAAFAVDAMNDGPDTAVQSVERHGNAERGTG